MAQNLIPSLIALVIVLALVPAALLLVRRLGGSTGAGGALAVRASLALGPRERLVIVEAAGKWLLVGVTAQSMRTLAEFSEAPILGDTDPSGFGRLLARARRGAGQ